MTDFENYKSRSERVVRLSKLRKVAAFVVSTVAGILHFCCRRPPSASPRRVVLLEPFGMGDVISLIPAIKALKADGWEVCVAAKAPWRALLCDSNEVDWLSVDLPWSAYQVRKKYENVGQNISSILSCARMIREHYPGSIGIDPRGDARSLVILALAGCSRIISTGKYIGSDAANVPAFFSYTKQSFESRRWEIVLEAARSLGVTGGICPPEIPRPNVAVVPQRVGLIPVAPWEGKRWRIERWIELCKILRARGFDREVFVGPGQATEGSLLEPIANVVSIRSIDEWKHALASCEIVVTLDTGPMHLADAMKIPTVALFGSSVLPLWAPSLSLSVVLDHSTELEGLPCQQVERFVDLGNQAMDLISVDEVMDAVELVEKRLRSSS